MQMRPGRLDRGVTDRVVGPRPRRVRPDQRQDSGGEQQRPTDRLAGEDGGDPGRLDPRAAAEQTITLQVGVGHGHLLPGSVEPSPTRLPGTPDPILSDPGLLRSAFDAEADPIPGAALISLDARELGNTVPGPS